MENKTEIEYLNGFKEIADVERREVIIIDDYFFSYDKNYNVVSVFSHDNIENSISLVHFFETDVFDLDVCKNFIKCNIACKYVDNSERYRYM